MVKPEVIRRRLDKLEEYLTYLEQIRHHSQEEFLEHTEIWASTERFLQMAIKSVNDIASLIISEEDLGTFEQYRDIPVIFFKGNIIDKDLKQKWIRMIGVSEYSGSRLCRNRQNHSLQFGSAKPGRHS